MDLLFSSHFPQSLKKLQGRCFFWGHGHERDRLTEEKFQKDTKAMAISGTAEDQQSAFLKLFGGVKSKLWDAGVPPIVGPHKEPGLLQMSPRYISSPSLLPGVQHPGGTEGETFSVYLWAPSLPWHLHASCMSDPGKVPGNTHTHFHTADSASCSQVSEGYFWGKLEVKRLVGSTFAVIVIIYLPR